MVIFVSRDVLIAAICAVVAATLSAQSPLAQTPSTPRAHLTIPFLANATKPSALEFEGAECDLDASGDRMSCVFQQVFLTTSAIAPDTCLVTTNRYERSFHRDSPTHWTSPSDPVGVCGVLDVVTLQDDGGVRWTMELRTEVTKKDAGPVCRSVDVTRETFSWRDIRRLLPCKFVQPGGLTP